MHWSYHLSSSISSHWKPRMVSGLVPSTEWHPATSVQLLEDKSLQSMEEVKPCSLIETGSCHLQSHHNGLNWYNTKIKLRSYPHPTTHELRLAEGWEETFSVPGNAVPVFLVRKLTSLQCGQMTFSSSLSPVQISTCWPTLVCHLQGQEREGRTAVTHREKVAFNCEPHQPGRGNTLPTTGSGGRSFTGRHKRQEMPCTSP